MIDLARDALFALRVHRRGAIATVLAVLTLAVAIGGNATVFSIVDAALYAPTSVDAPDRLVLIEERHADDMRPGMVTATSSLRTLAELRARSREVDVWAAFRNSIRSVRGSEWSEPANVLEVSPAFLEVLGVRLARGRGFTEDEAHDAEARVALVTPEFWDRWRGDDLDPLGGTLVLDGDPHTVVGVVPAEFRFQFSNADVWVPLDETPAVGHEGQRDVVTLGRLHDGVAMSSVRAEVGALSAQLRTDYPVDFSDWKLHALNLGLDLPGQQTTLLFALLQGAVLCVLLIACTNIINLLLARGQERTREVALRLAIGAGRGRLIRQFATEAAVLAAGGAALGLAFGWVGLRLLGRHVTTVMGGGSGFEPELNARVLGFTLVIAVVASLLIGILPALRVSPDAQLAALRDGHKSTGGRGRKLVSRGLVVAQLALSLVALGGGGMLLRGLVALRSGDLGYDPAPLLTGSLQLPDSAAIASDGEQEPKQELVLADLLDTVQGIPGARIAALVSVLPGGMGRAGTGFRLPGNAADDDDLPTAFLVRVSPGYGGAFGVPVLQGRFFSEADDRAAAPVAVVSRSFAERWLAGAGAIGRTLEVAGATRQIVGVVGDVQQTFNQSPGAQQTDAIYLPLQQSPVPAPTLVVRVDGEPELLTDSVRAALHEVEPDATFVRLLPMSRVLDQMLFGVNLFTTILGLVGGMALFLACTGTYGLLAYSVSQRRHEIGIRMAVGAERSRVLRMVMREGAIMAGIGLGVGTLALIPVGNALRNVMSSFANITRATGALMAVLLFAVSLAASFLPAYRASAIDPVNALRGED